MALEVKYNHELQIVESVFKGTVSVEELLSETERSIALAHEHKSYRFLCNAKHAIFSMSIINVMTLDKMSFDHKLPRTAKTVIIEPDDENSRQFVQYYEDTSFNSGWVVGIRKDRESALEWLLNNLS